MEQVGTQIKRMQATAAADRADLYGFFKKICENQRFQKNQRHQRAIFTVLKVVPFIFVYLICLPKAYSLLHTAGFSTKVKK